MASIAVIASVVGTVVSVAASIQGAVAAAEQNSRVQQMLDADIEAESERADREVGAVGVVAARKSAALTAALASSGVSVGTGTPVDLLKDIDRQRGQHQRDIARESGATITRLRNQKASSARQAQGTIIGSAIGIAGGIGGGLLGAAAALPSGPKALDSTGSVFAGQERNLVTSVQQLPASLPGRRPFILGGGQAIG